MKRILFIFLLLSFSVKIFGQQFSQYNTGSLYDSFENPSQKAFITDSSKQFASNFLMPTFNSSVLITGNIQSTLKSRAFENKYSNSALVIGDGRWNHLDVHVNAYDLMFKIFSSLNGDVELGFAFQTRAEGTGLFSDESAAILNGANSFKANTYSGIFNDSYYFQSYHQASFTYKEKINKHFTLGAKLGLLMGIQYEDLHINNSEIVFDKPNDSAILGLSGLYYSSYIPGHLVSRDYLPTFRNPGASISLGATYRTEDGFIIQGNIKDLGFIHWSNRSHVYQFDDISTIKGLSTNKREGNIYDEVERIIHDGGIGTAFNTPIDGRAELSINQQFWIDDDKNFKYSPTLIASKQLFYPGFVGALVNPVKYKNYTVTLTTTYDDLKLFNLGGQFMYQTPNFDFFIGTDKISQTGSIVKAAATKPQTFQNAASSGGSIFLGLALKIGPVIEHPMNASTIPTGEKGFLGRLWGRIFKTDN